MDLHVALMQPDPTLVPWHIFCCGSYNFSQCLEIRCVAKFISVENCLSSEFQFFSAHCFRLLGNIIFGGPSSAHVGLVVSSSFIFGEFSSVIIKLELNRFWAKLSTIFADAAIKIDAILMHLKLFSS